MKHDLNNSPSYEHMMGSPKKAHEGSQSSTPAPEKNPGGYTQNMVGSKTGAHLPAKAPNGMDYS